MTNHPTRAEGGAEAGSSEVERESYKLDDGGSSPPRPTNAALNAIDRIRAAFHLGNLQAFEREIRLTLRAYDGEQGEIEACQDCNAEQPLVWTAPDELWERVMRRADGGGVVCPRCFDVRAEEGGVGLLRWVPEPIDAWRSKEATMTEGRAVEAAVERTLSMITKEYPSMHDVGPRRGRIRMYLEELCQAAQEEAEAKIAQLTAAGDALAEAASRHVDTLTVCHACRDALTAWQQATGVPDVTQP